MAVLFDTRGCTRGQIADKEMELQGAVSPLPGSSTLAPRDSLTYPGQITSSQSKSPFGSSRRCKRVFTHSLYSEVATATRPDSGAFCSPLAVPTLSFQRTLLHY